MRTIGGGPQYPKGVWTTPSATSGFDLASLSSFLFLSEVVFRLAWIYFGFTFLLIGWAMRPRLSNWVFCCLVCFLLRGVWLCPFKLSFSSPCPSSNVSFYSLFACLFFFFFFVCTIRVRACPPLPVALSRLDWGRWLSESWHNLFVGGRGDEWGGGEGRGVGERCGFREGKDIRSIWYLLVATVPLNHCFYALTPPPTTAITMTMIPPHLKMRHQCCKARDLWGLLLMGATRYADHHLTISGYW